MRRYFNFEINGGDYRQTGTEKVGFVKRADFGDISSRQHTDTDSHIPGGQVSGSCCSSLTVGGKVDEQGIESGNMIPNPMPINKAIPKNRIVQAVSLH